MKNAKHTELKYVFLSFSEKKVIMTNNYYSKADQAAERFISVFALATFYYNVKNGIFVVEWIFSSAFVYASARRASHKMDM